ncbi:MAG: winged helix-turn-helix domain-containing protein [Pseudomonadota bacterium]
MTSPFGRWTIDTTTRRAHSDGVSKTLSPRAVRLAIELAHAAGAVCTRAELLDRVWPDVFVSDESLSQVVTELRRKLGAELIETIPRTGYRLTTTPPCPVVQDTDPAPFDPGFDLEAHALCLEARREVVRCGRGSIERADALTEEAVSLAPNCASVRAERAIALVRRHTYWSEGRHRLEEALQNAQRALELDPTLALAHSALGYTATIAGQWQAAERAHRAALARETRDPVILHNAAWYLMSRGRIGAAVTYFEQVGDQEPQNVKGYLIAAQLAAGFDTARARRNAEQGLRRAELRLAVDPVDPRALSASASLMALLGEPLAAANTLDQVDVTESSQAIYHAAAWSRIGETERARRLLEELFDHGWRDTYWLDAEPGFAPLRGDRRFQQMRQSLVAA